MLSNNHGKKRDGGNQPGLRFLPPSQAKVEQSREQYLLFVFLRDLGIFMRV